MQQKTKNILLIFLIIISGIIYYYLANPVVTYESHVIKIIDGDSLETELGTVRLLGINTPERDMPYYEEAKQFLESLILNKTIKLKLIKGNEIDKYDRILAYVFSDKEHVNKEILEQGLANLYVYEEDKYLNDLRNAESQARENKLGIWKKSSNYDCIELIEFKYEEPEYIILENNCQILNITIKDDANHIFKETIDKKLEKNFSHVFNNEGDSLFIWDSEGLILFYRY